MLNMSALELIRKNEDIFKLNYKNANLTEDQWIEILIEHPKLIERPIVINNGKAVIARPTELIEKIL